MKPREVNDTMKNEAKAVPKAVLYLRSASAKSDEQCSAIAMQRQACQRRADELGAQVVHEYVDCGVSGRMSERQRELGRLLEEMKAEAHGHIDYVIVFDHARLARDAIVYTHVVWELERAGVELQIASIPIAEQETYGSLANFMMEIGRRQVEVERGEKKDERPSEYKANDEEVSDEPK